MNAETSELPYTHNGFQFDFFEFFDLVVNSSATTTEKLMALITGRHIGRNGEAAFPRRARVMQQASCSENTFQRSLGAMRLFFEVEQRKGRSTLYHPKPSVTASDIEKALANLRDQSTPQNGVYPKSIPQNGAGSAPQNGAGVHPKMGRHKIPLKEPLKEGCPNGHLASDEPKPPSPKGIKASEAARMAFDRYNEIAARVGLPAALVLSAGRKQKIIARIKDAGGWSGFERAMANLEHSAFLQGRNDKGFRADFDFLCQAKSFGRLLDGGYGNGAHASAYPARKKTKDEMTIDELREHYERGGV